MSHYADTGLTKPCTDSMKSGVGLDSHSSTSVEVTGRIATQFPVLKSPEEEEEEEEEEW